MDERRLASSQRAAWAAFQRGCVRVDRCDCGLTERHSKHRELHVNRMKAEKHIVLKEAFSRDCWLNFQAFGGEIRRSTLNLHADFAEALLLTKTPPQHPAWREGESKETAVPTLPCTICRFVFVPFGLSPVSTFGPGFARGQRFESARLRPPPGEVCGATPGQGRPALEGAG